MAAMRRQGEEEDSAGRDRIQQISWMPDLGEEVESESKDRRTDRDRKSRRRRRPWRSPAAMRSGDGRSSTRECGRELGAHRMAVTKGEREAEEEEPLGGGGRGRVAMCWRERESMTEMEAPEAKARRPDGERSRDPKLLRLGGPGSIASQLPESGGRGWDDISLAGAEPI